MMHPSIDPSDALKALSILGRGAAVSVHPPGGLVTGASEARTTDGYRQNEHQTLEGSRMRITILTCAALALVLSPATVYAQSSEASASEHVEGGRAH